MYKRDPKTGRLIPRSLSQIIPMSSYDGSITLNFYYKGYDRPADESGASWSSAFTHVTTGGVGNEEVVNIDQATSNLYHIIRVDGTLKEEAFEIQALGLVWS